MKTKIPLLHLVTIGMKKRDKIQTIPQLKFNLLFHPDWSTAEWRDLRSRYDIAAYRKDRLNLLPKLKLVVPHQMHTL